MDEKATLKDVLNYEPEQYITKDELALIKATFGGNEKLLQILRKVLIPTITDGGLPIEDFAKDSFIVDKDWSMIPIAEVKSLIVARQDAIKFIFGGLIKLKVMANNKSETEAEEIARRTKDSTK